MAALGWSLGAFEKIRNGSQSVALISQGGYSKGLISSECGISCIERENRESGGDWYELWFLTCNGWRSSSLRIRTAARLAMLFRASSAGNNPASLRSTEQGVVRKTGRIALAAVVYTFPRDFIW